MTFDEFREKEEELKLTHNEFAEIIGYSESAIKAWKRNGVPKWVDIVMEHLIMIKDVNKSYEKYHIK